MFCETVRAVVRSADELGVPAAVAFNEISVPGMLGPSRIGIGSEPL